MGKFSLRGALVVSLCFAWLSTSAFAQDESTSSPASEPTALASASAASDSENLTPSEADAQLTDAQLTDEQRDDLAREEFEIGRGAYEQGNFALALQRFRHAYALSGRAQLYFNIGQSADRLRRDEEAIEAFEAFLEQVPDHPNRALAHRRLGLLRAQASVAPENVEDPDTPRAVSPTIIAGSQEPFPEEPEEDDSSVLESPVFWVVVGAVVAGGVVAAILLSSSGPEAVDDGSWNGRHLVGLTWGGP